MQIALLQDRRFDRREVELAIRAARREQLRAAGEELRRAAFIRLDMRMLVADDAVKRPAELREREAVRGRAVEDEEHLAIRLENLAHQIAHALRPLISP